MEAGSGSTRDLNENNKILNIGVGLRKVSAKRAVGSVRIYK